MCLLFDKDMYGPSVDNAGRTEAPSTLEDLLLAMVVPFSDKEVRSTDSRPPTIMNASIFTPNGIVGVALAM